MRFPRGTFSVTASLAAAALSLRAVRLESRHRHGSIHPALAPATPIELPVAAADVPHRKFAVDRACSLDATGHPTGWITVNDLSGAHTGPCIAALREMYLDEDGAALAASQHSDYAELLRSCLEVLFVIAMRLADDEIDEHGCEDPDCPTNDVLDNLSDWIRPPLMARLLLRIATSYEATCRGHLDSCQNCRDAGEQAPGMIRARLCRDIADDVVLNTDDNMRLRGAPIQAAFDVCCHLLDLATDLYGDTAAEQIESLSKGLVYAIGAEGQKNG